tara:strand:+ start:3424 stop:5826 length:2403 start_codon:yes stop_codon:yes gene_type:complete
MKIFKNLLFLVFVFFLSTAVKSQKVIGYMDVNLSEAETRMNLMEWNHMTDFIYGFITPNTSGVLPDPTGLKLFNDIKQKCIDNGVDLHFSSGGAANSGMFHTIGQNSTATANFAKEIADVMEDHGMVGWDLDWEFPRTAAEQVSQVNILKAVHDEFTARGKRDEWHIAIAVGGETPSVGTQGIYHTDYCSADAFQYIDYLNMMSYDIGRSISGDNNHSSYADAVNNVIDWNSKGCPIEKMVLGVPFYARHKTTRGLPPGSFYDITYGNMSNDAPATYFNQDNKGDYYYNGAPTLRQKVDYIMQQGGVGIMIWEVTYDRFDSYSLLKVLHEEMEKYRCSAPTPELGENVSICGLSEVTLNSGVSPQSGVTFTWKDESQTLVNQSSTASAFDAPSAGVYTVEVWQDGCNRSDEIEVTGVLNVPDLGGPYELCDPVSISLDAAVSGNGRAIEWRRDNQVLSGETNSTLLVKQGGDYKVTVSATGCTSVNATTTVTSEVPYAEADTVCMSGDAASIEASEVVKWYDAENALTEIATGEVFSPMVNSNITYWMGGAGSALTEYTTLKSSFAGGWGASVSNYGTKITVVSQINITEITVNPVAAGTLKLNLKSDDGTTILKTTSNTVSSGEQAITLSWENITPGVYFIDAEGSSMSLKMDGTLAASDFEIPGVLTSEKHCYEKWGGSYSASTNYGFFLNLKIMAGKECGKVPVHVVIDANNDDCLTVVENEIQFKDMKIYPNPSGSEFTVSNVSGEMSIYDVKGSFVDMIYLSSASTSFGSNLNKGVYFIKIKSEDAVITKKVIKK